MDGAMIGTVVGLLLATLFNTLVIYLVGKTLKLGMEIDNFFTAFAAALLCAIVGIAISRFFSDSLGSLGSTAVHILINTVVLMVVAAILPGMRTKGIIGALVAAIAMGAISWLLAALVKALAS